VNPVDEVDDTIRNLLDDEVDDVRSETAFRVYFNDVLNIGIGAVRT